jgi:hypothetical protein
MKIGEEIGYHEGSGQIVVKRTFDHSYELERAAQLRQQGLGQKGESRMVGTIPLDLMAQWCKEAGVKWDDIEARKQVVKRKIMSGDFDKLRVWKGRY